MKNVTAKIKERIPDDWLFKILSNTMTTTLTFYLFQFANRIAFIKELWNYNDKNFIRTFLVLQVVVGIFFYFVLKSIFSKVLLNLLIDRVAKLGGKLDVSDLRDISKIKSFLVDLFDLNVIHPDELVSLEILSSDKEKIIRELADDLAKWISLFIQLSLVSLLVYQLSAWYILPLLIAALVLIGLFGVAVSAILHSLPFLEKIRCELVLKQNKN